MKQLGVAWMLLLVLAACASQREVDAPSPVKAAATVLRSPKDVVADFRATLRAESISNALFQLDEVDYGTPAAAQVRFRIKKLAEEMARGAYDFAPLEEQIQDDCAAVIIRENANRPGPAQYGVMFLLKREEGWKLSPEPQNFQKFLSLSSGQSNTFLVLDRWFQLRKADIKVQERTTKP